MPESNVKQIPSVGGIDEDIVRELARCRDHLPDFSELTHFLLLTHGKMNGVDEREAWARTLEGIANDFELAFHEYSDLAALARERYIKA
jgi:hypothetical protein